MTDFQDEKKLGEIEYLYQKINNISPPESFQNLINRVLYIFDEIERIYYTGEIKFVNLRDIQALENNRSFICDTKFRK